MFGFWKKKKPSGSHGSHFSACFPEEGLAQMMVKLSVNKPDKSEELLVNLPDFKNAKLIVDSKIIDESLLVKVLIVNGTIYTAYPINRNFVKLKDCKNPKVNEWQNELEGWVNIHAGPATLEFFAVDYYKNKDRYKNSKQLDISFSGIAYSISKSKGEEFDSKYGKIKTDKMCCLIPVDFKEENAFPDDYFFRGEVLDIKTDKVDGNSFFVKVINAEKELVFSIWIRCSSDGIKDKIKKGDYVSGRLWLQGTLVD